MKIKKILMGVFALTLSVVGLVAGTHTVKAESTTLKMTDSGWWWQRIQPDDGNYHSWHLTWYEFNGRIAYCIQPGIPEGDTYQTGNLDSYNISTAGLNAIDGFSFKTELSTISKSSGIRSFNFIYLYT